MKPLSNATLNDFEILLNQAEALRGFATAEEAAQAFVTVLYDYFQESLVLLRLFTTVRYGELPASTRQFVDRRAHDTGTAHLINDRTPVFSLLGTRGQDADWNERHKSQRFRCIPLASGKFVASLPMMSMQLRSMAFDLDLIDAWDAEIVAKGRADDYSGTLFIENAATDRDEQGRMIVPIQKFVAEYNVKTVLGFGSGYAHHPTLVTLFAFTSEILVKPAMEPFALLLKTYKSLSEELVRQGRVFVDR